MESLSQRLEHLMREAGYNPRSLSLAAGLGETAVRDIIDGRIASPRYSTLQSLARVLGIGVTFLARGERASTADVESARASPLTGPRDLPVYGAAEGGASGAMVLSSDAIQWVSRPEPLLTVRQGYGVFVVGESMSPAYEQGDIALIHPSRPARRDSDVILVRREPDGTEHVLIKRLIGWTDENWRVRQYNPAKEFDLSRNEWAEIQTIVGKYHGR